MGNCTSGQTDSENEENNQTTPPRRNSHKHVQTSPIPQQRPAYTISFPPPPPPTVQNEQEKIKRQEALIRSFMMAKDQSQVKKPKIDAHGFLILSENPHLRYNEKLTIQSDAAFGNIYFAYLSNKSVALKEYNCKRSIDREVEMLSSLDHVNIVKFLMQFNAVDTRYFLVTERIEQLSRTQHLNNDAGKRDVMMQLTNAVAYLQKMKIVHCQIIPQNVYAVSNGQSNTFKLANFKHALKIKGPSQYTDMYYPNFAAPEIAAHAQVTLASDLWSLACVFYAITTAENMMPVRISNEVRQVNAKVNSIKGKSVNFVLLKDLLFKMFKYQAHQRLSTEQVQSHPFFWSAKQMVDLIVETSRNCEGEEERSQVIQALNKGSHAVIGENWVSRVDSEVIEELMAIRKKGYSKNGGLNEKSIRNLISTVRNISVHARSVILVKYMGDSDETLMEYWNERFPNLIKHLYNAKIQQ